MSTLPENHKMPTLDLLKERMQEHHNNNNDFKYFIKPIEIKNSKRFYFGMSQAGHKCDRYLKYSYLACASNDFSINGVLATQDGHIQEQLFIERVNLFLPELKLITEERGEQIKFSDFEGHFSGHADGVIKGILEAPTSWHIWEHKSTNEKKFNDLKKKVKEYGCKQALENWDYTYFIQSQLYMHYSTLKRHFLTVSTPGGRDYISIRTEYNSKISIEYIEKSKKIIFDDSLPEKMSDKPEFFECKWCCFQDICHFNDVPDVNCKTCQSCKPVENKLFYCDKNKKNIDDIYKPCDKHIFKSFLIPMKTLASDKDFNLYEIDKSIGFVNCSKSDCKKDSDNDMFLIDSYTLKNKIKNFDNLQVEKIRSFFNGEIIDGKIDTFKSEIIKGI